MIFKDLSVYNNNKNDKGKLCPEILENMSKVRD